MENKNEEKKKMQKNTKFLWMYIAILFSFALILIVFAGWSSNKDDEETRGLQNSVERVSMENTELRNKIASLEKNVETVTTERNDAISKRDVYKTQNDSLVASDQAQAKIDEILIYALDQYDAGNRTACRETLAQIDANTMVLTPTQQYLYDMMMN